MTKRSISGLILLEMIMEAIGVLIVFCQTGYSLQNSVSCPTGDSQKWETE